MPPHLRSLSLGDELVVEHDLDRGVALGFASGRGKPGSGRVVRAGKRGLLQHGNLGFLRLGVGSVNLDARALGSRLLLHNRLEVLLHLSNSRLIGDQGRDYGVLADSREILVDRGILEGVLIELEVLFAHPRSAQQRLVLDRVRGGRVRRASLEVQEHPLDEEPGALVRVNAAVDAAGYRLGKCNDVTEKREVKLIFLF